MEPQDLKDLVSDRLGGVKASHRVLEDHGDPSSPEAQHVALSLAYELLSVILD